MLFFSLSPEGLVCNLVLYEVMDLFVQGFPFWLAVAVGERSLL